MAYTIFSTEKADYVLQLNNHILENNHNIFECIDALVIETGVVSLEEIVFNINNINKPFSTGIKYCKENNIPIFGTDVPPTFCGEYLRDTPLDLVTAPIDLFYAFSKKKYNNTLARLCSDYNFILQQPLAEGRNAINARKIEEFVVSLISKDLDKKHPKIGMIFGAGHIGLKYDLQSKKRRDFTIWNWRNLNFKKYAGLNKEELNKVYEARYNENRWNVKEYMTNLFN